MQCKHERALVVDTQEFSSVGHAKTRSNVYRLTKSCVHQPCMHGMLRGEDLVRDVSQVVVGQAWCRCTCLVVESVTTPAESSTTRQFSFYKTKNGRDNLSVLRPPPMLVRLSKTAQGGCNQSSVPTVLASFTWAHLR